MTLIFLLGLFLLLSRFLDTSCATQEKLPKTAEQNEMQIESMTKEEIAHLKEALAIEQRHQDSSLIQIAVKSATSKMIGFVLTGIIAVCAFLYNIGDNQKDMQRIMSTQNERIQNLSSLLTRMQDQISRNTEKISEIWYRGNFNIERHLDMKGGEIETDGPKK